QPTLFNNQPNLSPTNSLNSSLPDSNSNSLHISCSSVCPHPQHIIYPLAPFRLISHVAPKKEEIINNIMAEITWMENCEPHFRPSWTKRVIQSEMLFKVSPLNCEFAARKRYFFS
ncbi:hypothetical protein OTU49_002754, partial [Cherax quadricarinatus]